MGRELGRLDGLGSVLALGVEERGVEALELDTAYMERYIFFQTFLDADFSDFFISELPDFFEDKSQILCDAHNTEKSVESEATFHLFEITGKLQIFQSIY